MSLMDVMLLLNTISVPQCLCEMSMLPVIGKMIQIIRIRCKKQLKTVSHSESC